jgi:hypothetical protein
MMAKPLKEQIEASAETLHFVTQHIVEYGYQPTRDQNWRGRDDIVQIAADNFKSTIEAAESLVDAAVDKLWSAEIETSIAAERRMMILRLKRLQEVLYKHLTSKKRTVHYDFKPVLKPSGDVTKKKGKIVYEKILKSGSTTRHVTPALGRLYIEVEDRLARLLGIIETEDVGDLKRQMKEQMEEAMKQRSGDKTTVTIHNMPLDGLPPKAKQIVATLRLPSPTPKPTG